MPDTRDEQLHQALESWRDWPLPLQGPPRVMGAVPGGRTNRNIQLQAPGLDQPILLRLNTHRAASLGIRRDHEAQILDTVADAGLCPRPLYRDPANRFLLMPFIEARTWTAEDLKIPANLARVEALLADVRALNPATPRRYYRDYLEHYWQQLEQAGAVTDKLKRQWQDFRPRLTKFDAGNWQPALTHHDLIPENLLDTGTHLYLIDWEYAAIGHPDIDRWCLDPDSVREPFIHELAQWTNELWERVMVNGTSDV